MVSFGHCLALLGAPCIAALLSFVPPAPLTVIRMLVGWLQLPTQGNFCDCGLFLLTYAEFFIHKLPPGKRSSL